MKKIGVLYSGGLDSAALIGDFFKKGFEVWPVYTEFGLPWEKTEKDWASKYLRALKSSRIKPLLNVRLLLEGAYSRNWSQTGRTPGADSTDDEVFLPARNLLLITKALLVLSTKDVWHIALATLKGNPFPDGTERYFKLLEKVLADSFRHRIKISVPFRHSSKEEVLRHGHKLPLHLSFSCINPQGERHCGRCNKCAERQRAFHNAGIIDKTTYKNRIGN